MWGIYTGKGGGKGSFLRVEGGRGIMKTTATRLDGVKAGFELKA